MDMIDIREASVFIPKEVWDDYVIEKKGVKGFTMHSTKSTVMRS